MDDEEALLALADGDPAAMTRAKEALAERYFARLCKALEGVFSFRREVAEFAAGTALMNLYRRAQKDLGGLKPDNDGVWRWLLKAGQDAAVDRLRWLRRRMAFGTAVIAGNDDRAQSHPVAPERADVATGTPEDRAVTKELAERALAFVMRLGQPARGILLFDMLELYEDLCGQARELHDQELIDCSKEHRLYSRNALRSARTRAKVQLRKFLNGGSHGGQ